MRGKFQQGVFQQERIDCLQEEMVRILYRDGQLKLTQLVKRMKHHYKDERSGVESLRRYLSMGVFAGIKYKSGKVYLTKQDGESI